MRNKAIVITYFHARELNEPVWRWALRRQRVGPYKGWFNGVVLLISPRWATYDIVTRILGKY